MKWDSLSWIMASIRRLLDWLASLVGRKTGRAGTRPTAGEQAGRPEARVDESPPVNIPSPATPTEAQRACERGGATAHEPHEKAAKASDQVEPSALGKTIGTSVQDREEAQRDTSSEPEIEPTGESGSSLQAPAQPSIGPSSDKHEKILDETPPAPDRSDLGVPDTNTSAKVESERRRDDGRNRPDEEAEDRERSAVPPEERGGRPRRAPPAEKLREPKRQLPRTLRPEIVCWKSTREREWVVGVEIPDDISQASISVLQADKSLSEDPSRAGCYPLATLNRAVEVHITDTNVARTMESPADDGDWLLFKLSGTDLAQGRNVKQISSGSYLAIIPKTWQRDEEKAGSPPTMPEPVFLDGYLAHFFELTQANPSRIAFRDDQGKEISIGSGGPGFALSGEVIPDASERIGPLFGDQPPRICIANGHWSDVATIVVGQEGSGRQRWRKSFEPKLGQAQQQLPAEVLERKAGWYFLRFYDSTDMLIDSLDFRFVVGLKEISIPTAGPAPSPDGHVAQTVEIVHDGGYRVTEQEQKCPGVKVERDTDKTILTIPPMAECDRTSWLIRPPNSHGREVEFTILIGRIWWALGVEDTKPSQWGDRCVRLTPEDFTATSGSAIWLRFPKPRWANNIFAGFARERARKFPVKVTDSVVSIPLRDFSGAQELDDRAAEHKFKVWLETWQGTHELAIGILPAQEEDACFDLATVPAHRLATVLTKIRRLARGPTRRVIKEVRRKYRRARRSQRGRNADFVKYGLCLIAVLMGEAHKALVGPRLSNYWKRNAKLAHREFPDIAEELEKALPGVER